MEPGEALFDLGGAALGYMLGLFRGRRSAKSDQAKRHIERDAQVIAQYLQAAQVAEQRGKQQHQAAADHADQSNDVTVVVVTRSGYLLLRPLR